jgi:threonine dehydratase
MVTVDDITAAAGRIAGVAVRTPLLSNAILDERTRGRVFLKAETLQRAGSFKIRGAWNRMSQIPGSDRSKGVVAISAGNHAQGVAIAGRRLGIPATIVMPSDAAKPKIEATRRLGAEIRFYDRVTEDREAIARDIVESRGAILIHPFDDPEVIAGQGTIGLEMAADARAQGHAFDEILAPCGGGGLIAGVAVAIKAASDRTRFWAVEAEGFNDTGQSLAAGRRVRIDMRGKSSICDALLTPQPGALTFEMNRQLLAGGVTVTDAEVRHAMGFAAKHLKIVVEPGGAVGLAAVLGSRLETAGRIIGVVLSGANVDPQMFAAAVAAYAD